VSGVTSAEDLLAAPPLRWGILGAGGIAAAFTHDVMRHTRGQVVAVGSRSLDRAERFAAENGVTRAHASYEQLVDDAQVEAVYVASPHSEHLEHALLAIGAGKHVLVEKAFTRNAGEAERVLDAAGAAGVFAMEAMWTRFLPHMRAVHEVIDRGEIGEVVGLIADHGQNMGHHPPSHRLHAPELAGGALLDLGVYPVSFAHDLLGAPDRVRALGSLTPTGVDGQASIALGFGDAAQASLHTTLWARTATTAVVFGSAGRIELATDFYRPTTFVVVRDDGVRWSFTDAVDDGLQYEAAEVARCVAEGRTESPRMTWQGTLAVMRTMDEVRRQVGVVYPGE
jgi:predicted dehydrogenase